MNDQSWKWHSRAYVILTAFVIFVVPGAALVDAASTNVAARIQEKIRKEGVAALAPINVHEEQGIAVLTGRVDTLWQRERAAQLAKEIDGVRSVVNLLNVRYVPGTMGKVRQSIRSAGFNPIAFDLVFRNGTLTMGGQVNLPEDKARLLRAIKDTPGVRMLNTDIETELEPTGRTATRSRVPDEEIEAAVRDAYFHDPRIVYFVPRVAAKDGVLTLGGYVGSPLARIAAEDTAANTVGVTEVRNNLQVRPFQLPSASPRARRIERDLQRDLYIDASEIIVVVSGDTAQLTGTVDSQWEKARAARIASRVNGVSNVQNLLVVRDHFGGARYDEPFGPSMIQRHRLLPQSGDGMPGGHVFAPYLYPPPVYPPYPYADQQRWTTGQRVYSDRQIRERVERQLAVDNFINPVDVDVDVRDGVVTLSGSVETWADRQRAQRNAYEGGARVVVNRLRVQP